MSKQSISIHIKTTCCTAIWSTQSPVGLGRFRHLCKPSTLFSKSLGYIRAPPLYVILYSYCPEHTLNDCRSTFWHSGIACILFTQVKKTTPKQLDKKSTSNNAIDTNPTWALYWPKVYDGGILYFALVHSWVSLALRNCFHLPPQLIHHCFEQWLVCCKTA